MIIRPRPHWLRLLFVRRGSIVSKIFSQQLFIFLLSCLVVAAHGELLNHKITLTSSPFSLMGVALAIFLGFRINASYERYWEARKHWGAVLVEARNLARQLLTLPGGQEKVRPLILGIAAFAAAMRNHLRGDPRERDLAPLLPPETLHSLREKRNTPVALLLWLAEEIAKLQKAGLIEALQVHRMTEVLDKLSFAWGSCERIAYTPLPFTYTVILHRSAYLYCVLLPFGLVDAIGMMTPLVVCFVSYTFFALEALSDEIEEPFGRQANDLALDAMAAGIEASLREMLGETPAPAIQPDSNFILT